ncbi:hypothetical protein Clacol_003973 [Clathrus columnatus]|uniref:Protein kinase domain-containing protein n=1 Tax=Clathrus columnatus TaxID=1419009 RepID=A0AAV5A554_9AGAM|nr:hypothetical protein Clacol_003973 [Clathrus columnatus]
MLPLNAFSSVTIHGLVFKDGVSIPQTFERGISRHGRINHFEVKSFIRPGGLPKRPPSNLPPPGNDHLIIMLGDTLGSGRVGTVHQAALLTHNTNLPQLVVKISRQNRSAYIEQEAWYYEELEQVQGIAMPRCYGLFRARIEEGTEVKIWGDDKKGSDKFDQSHSRGFPQAVDSLGEKLPRMPTPDPALLSVLLFERLGGRMPIQEPIDHIRDDIFEVYNDLSRLGIEHLDIRWSNILSVIQDPDYESSGIVCPNHGRVHQWRVVDFDLARKTNGTTVYLDKCTKGWLERLFFGLSNGRIIEPWE